MEYTNAVSKSYRSSVTRGQKRLEKMWDDEERQRRNQAVANALLVDKQVEAGTHVRNADGSVSEKKPGFLDYLNPFGDYGLFGKHNTTRAAKAGADMADAVGGFVDDKILKEEGNDKFDSGRDVARFALNLVPGIVAGLLESGKNFREATHGTRQITDDSGNIVGEEELDGTQRWAAATVGTLDTVGLALGGSGKLIKEIVRKPLDNALKTAAKSKVKDTAKGTIKDTVKSISGSEIGKTARRSGIEGVEESLQSVAEDLQDDSRLSEDWLANAGKGFTLGVAGGAIFDVSGRGVGRARDAARTAKVNKDTNTTADVRRELSNITNTDEFKALPEAKQATAINRLTEAAETSSAIRDSSSRIEDFRNRASETISKVAAEPTAKTDTSAEASPARMTEAQETTRLRQAEKVYSRIEETSAQIKALVDGTDPSVRKIEAADGTDVTSVAAKYEKDIQSLQTQISDLKQQAEGSNLNGEAVGPLDGSDPSVYTADVEARARAAEKIPELEQRIQELQAEQAQQFELLGGTQTVIDTKAASAKFRELKAQRDSDIKWLTRNDLGETEASLKQRLEDINNGVVPEEFVTIRDDVNDVAEVVSLLREVDANDTTGLQRAALINEVHRASARAKLDSLYKESDHQVWQAEYDQNYHLRKEQINEYPGPRQKEELEMLDAEYAEVVAERRGWLAENADEVSAAERALEIVDDIDRSIKGQFNDLQASDPIAFGKVDEDALQSAKTGLEVAYILKKAGNDPTKVSPIESESAVNGAIENAPNAKEAGKIIDEDVELSDQAAAVVADQLRDGNLNPNLASLMFVTTRSSLAKLENGQALLDVLDKGLTGQARANGELKVRARTNEWKRAYNTPESMEQSVKFLDEGVEMTRMDGETTANFDARKAAAEDIKLWFKEWADKRKAVDPNFKPRENYFSHIWDDKNIKNIPSIAEDLERLRTGINEKGNKLTAAQRSKIQQRLDGVPMATQQFIAQKKIYKIGKDGFAKERKGAEGYSRDLPFVLEMYNRSSVSAVYMQPAFDKVGKMTSNLGESQQAFVNAALDAIAGRKTASDKMIGERASRALSTTRKYSNMALMGASIRTAAIQPTAILNNWRLSKEMGGNTSQFVISNAKAFIANTQGVKKSPMLQEFLADGGMQEAYSSSLRSGRMSRAEDVMFSGITFMDRGMRLAAYDQGKQAWLRDNAKNRKSPTEAEIKSAKEHGMKAAREAQFGLGPLDIPIGNNSEIGKMIFQIQQFNIKQTGKEFSYLFGKQGVFRKNGWIDEKTGNINAVGARNLVKTVAGYSALVWLYTQMDLFGSDEEGSSANPLGIDFYDLIPFGEQVEGMVNVLTGEGEVKDIEIPVPIIASLTFGRQNSPTDSGILGGILDMTDPEVDKDEAFGKLLRSVARSFIPAGTQANRTLTGIEGLVAGESMNSSGSTRFLIDANKGWNIVKGLIGGQYATDEGQEWLRNGMNTIPRSETIEFDGRKVPVSEYVRNEIKDPAVQAQYIGYYATKQNAKKELAKNNMSTNDVVKDIRLRLTAGRISQAQANLEIDKHNQVLMDLYRPYIQDNPKLPAYISWEVENNILQDYVTTMNFR